MSEKGENVGDLLERAIQAATAAAVRAGARFPAEIFDRDEIVWMWLDLNRSPARRRAATAAYVREFERARGLRRTSIDYGGEGL